MPSTFLEIGGQSAAGMPLGGTAGQILTKLGSQAYNVGWRDATARIFEGVIGVNSQTELDALPTDGTAEAIVSTAFGSFQLHDILRYQNGSWRKVASLAATIPDESIGFDQLEPLIQDILEQVDSEGVVNTISVNAGGVMSWTYHDEQKQPQTGSFDFSTIAGSGMGGGGGITLAQAIAGTLAKLASDVSELSYDSDSNTITFTPDPIARQTNITMQELAAALRTTINDALAWKRYSRSVQAQWNQGSTAGAFHPTGITINPSDRSAVVAIQGLTGTYTLNLDSWRALAEASAGDSPIVAPSTANIAFNIMSRQFYVGRDNNTIMVSSGTVADTPTLTMTIEGRELADAALANNTARWSKSKLPSDTVYTEDLPTGGGDTDLSYTAAPGKGTVVSSTGDNADIPLATTTNAGLQSPADKQKQDNSVNPGAAFRDKALTGASPGKVQDIIDSFDGGTWADSAGTIATVPAVSTTLRSAAFTASQATSAAYALTAQEGTRNPNAHFVIRIPDSFDIPLGRLRARIGDGAYDQEEDPQTYIDLEGLTLITTSGGFKYYDSSKYTNPAGDARTVQILTPWELDPDRVSVNGGSLEDDTVTGSKMVSGQRLPEAQSSADVDKIFYADYSGGNPSVRLADPPTIGQLASEFNNTSVGLTISSTLTSTRRPAPAALTPTFNVTDSGNTHGQFFFSVDLNIAPVSDVNMSWERGTHSSTDSSIPERNVLVIEAPFISQLTAAAAYLSNASPGGVEIVDQPAYSANAEVGRFRVRAVVNNNEVAFFSRWEGKAGATGAVVTATVFTSLIRTDTAGRSGGGTPAASPVGNKLIALAAASGADAATAVNRKYVSAGSSGAAVESDWSDVTLVNDATAVRGVTVTGGNTIEFAEASDDVTVTVSMRMTTASASNNNNRMYNMFRLFKTPSGGTGASSAIMTSGITYNKITAFNPSSGGQGPDFTRLSASFDIEVAAGDSIKIQWWAALQVALDESIDADNSAVKVRIR